MAMARELGYGVRYITMLLNNYDIHIRFYVTDLFDNIGADAAGIAVFEENDRAAVRCFE